MDEKDFERIAQLLDCKLAPIYARLDQVDAKFNTLKVEIMAEVNQALDLQTQRLEHSFDLLAEGHAFLAEKTDRIIARVDEVGTKLEHRLDIIAIDLAVHRTDSDAHYGRYRVREAGAEFAGEANKAPTTHEEERLQEMRAIEEEADAYYADMGVERVKRDPDGVLRGIDLWNAKERVAWTLQKRAEAESE